VNGCCGPRPGAPETAELQRLGYRLAQGYHFGRPVPEPDFVGAVS
jgi:diguanylate cyclase